ncbi:hypothetical protein Lesp02_56460 [Lentzea sp. NBRC 105346]|uniref:hypothetical protein n=1 Tax=Lentzea sp. NBRC 105346 TaxID=3032205 RepID=UPI00249F9C29|nr:hypothetical protein [Lentzea sp. NBRC 105346]GLZ33458.1 hypothetical protein Lesp02_56460 [Lentzea sp. NBRC 105346]
MAETPFGNFLLYVIAAVAPSVLFWLLLRLPRLVRRLRHPKVMAEGPPVEAIAADLRRVRRVLRFYEPGTPALRRVSARQAYDELLKQACRAVQVEHQLDVLPEGVDKDIERLRVEESLRCAGLRLSD